MSATATAERAAHGMPDNVASIGPATPSTQTEIRPSSTEKKVDDFMFFNQRVSRYKGLRIDQYLRPSGVIRRFVVLNDHRHRALLGQPRRREIEPLELKQKSEGSTIWKTSELWELAERDAIRFMRELDRHIEELKSKEPQRSKRSTKQIASGTSLVPVSRDGEVRGLLLHAGMRDGGIFCIDLYDEDDGCVRRVEGSDLARALEVSQAQPLEIVRVISTGDHSVEIQEQRTGTHGGGSHSVRHARKTYEVVREASTSSQASQSFLRRQS